MSSFMEGYGQKEARRGRLILRIILSVLIVAIVGTAGYFYFRTWSEERVFARFKDTLAKQDYNAAYGMWCNAQKPCPYYPLEKFKADWAPPNPYANLDRVDVRNIDYCGSGVVFDLAHAGADPVAVWVEHSTGSMSFYPHQRCPGKHLQLGPFFKKLFGGGQEKG